MKKTNYRKQIASLALLTMALFLSNSSPAYSQKDQFMDRLQGSWQGAGKAYGGPARLQIRWEWVLGNKFLRLTLRSEIGGASGEKQIFEGQAYYRPASPGKYDAQWFDSRGVSMTIKATVEGQSLVALWSGAEENGRSTYRVIEPGKLEVIDEVQTKDGSWKEFGRAIVTRE